MDTKNTELRRAEENLVRLRKEAERQATKYKLLSTGTSSQKEAELQSEVDKLMVRPLRLYEYFHTHFAVVHHCRTY